MNKVEGAANRAFPTAQFRMQSPYRWHLNRRKTMSNVIDAEKVRAYVAQTLTGFGARSDAQLQESILIRGGLFCGRKYACDEYVGVWFIEEDQVKFFAPCGDLLLSDSLSACMFRDDEAEPARRAA
ncbi:MAG: hypothetical protein Aurels2KO_42270 [Aureliella sp.]